MTRVKKAVHALKHRRKLLKEAKGYRFGRSKKERLAEEALLHAGAYAFAHRRDKKGVFRRLWNVRIGAALAGTNFSYSRFMHALKKKNIRVNRKVLAALALHKPEFFKRIVQLVQ